jgi:D-lactate dehydrogenase
VPELLAPDVSRIAPETAEPAPDRAPDELAAGTPEPLRSDLVSLLGDERVLTRAIDIVSYASDASPYRLFPKAVVMARDAEDVSKVLAFGRERGIPVTLRAGGTSLNGQGQGDGILVDVRRHWSGVKVEDGGKRARVLPGTVLGHGNRVLASYGCKLGPDPASTDIACVGGVIANNSGGMRCGVTADSYSTVAELTFVLPSGTTIDTGAPGAEEAFAAAEPELAAGLAEIRDEIRADAELTERIRRKFEIRSPERRRPGSSCLRPRPRS